MFSSCDLVNDIARPDPISFKVDYIIYESIDFFKPNGDTWDTGKTSDATTEPDLIVIYAGGTARGGTGAPTTLSPKTLPHTYSVTRYEFPANQTFYLSLFDQDGSQNELMVNFDGVNPLDFAWKDSYTFKKNKYQITLKFSDWK